MAAIVYAPTQSGKSWKGFDVIVEKMKACSGNVCVLFITQANNTMSATQIKERARQETRLTECIPKESIVKSNGLPGMPGMAAIAAMKRRRLNMFDLLFYAFYFKNNSYISIFYKF